MAFTKGLRMDAAFWMRVSKTAYERNIDTDNDDAMRALIREIEESEAK